MEHVSVQAALDAVRAASHLSHRQMVIAGILGPVHIMWRRLLAEQIIVDAVEICWDASRLTAGGDGYALTVIADGGAVYRFRTGRPSGDRQPIRRRPLALVPSA